MAPILPLPVKHWKASVTRSRKRSANCFAGRGLGDDVGAHFHRGGYALTRARAGSSRDRYDSGLWTRTMDG